MVIYFYKYKGKKNVINKTLPTPTKILNEVTFKTDTSQENPTLILKYDNDIADCNYCFIGELNSFYFMYEPVLAQGYMTIELEKDLLKTCVTQILDMDCIIARNEHTYNTYLYDDRLPVLDKQQINTIAFSGGFANTDSFVLTTTSGGGANNGAD